MDGSIPRITGAGPARSIGRVHRRGPNDGDAEAFEEHLEQRAPTPEPELVRLEAAPRRRASQPKPSPDCEKRVQLVRIDGQVRALEVRCACGDVTVVELDYDAIPDEETPR